MKRRMLMAAVLPFEVILAVSGVACMITNVPFTLKACLKAWSWSTQLELFSITFLPFPDMIAMLFKPSSIMAV